MSGSVEGSGRFIIHGYCFILADNHHSPQNCEELLNLQHAQLRNVIERIFGVVKHRFQVLTSRPEIGYRQQALTVAAAGALHNFVRIHEPMNDLEDEEEYDVEGHAFLARGGGGDDQEAGAIFAVDDAQKARADARRDRIAQAMWDAYVLDHPDFQ